MENLQTHISNYLCFCQSQKRLDEKTLKAYRVDLKQFMQKAGTSDLLMIRPGDLEEFIASLHTACRPRTVKRKIASLKAFYHYLLYREVIERDPFEKKQVKFREPVILPRTIPLSAVELLLATMYQQRNAVRTLNKKRNTLRDIAVIELLFASGMRISELCRLKPADINLPEKTILIYGKGSRERRIQIGNNDVVNILSEYKEEYRKEIEDCGYFFVNHQDRPLSDQAVRRMINKYTSLAAISLHITPHMFRHTFATSLLEADVDIRCIQEMLGHSSINITEIYTHVTLSRQRDILTTKHPRKDFKL